MPRKVFVAGEILTASDVNTNLMDQSVMVFDDATARTTAIPTPVEGMVTYLSDEDEVQVFDGSAFKAVGPGKILQVVQGARTATFVVTSTGFLDVPDLAATITPSATTSTVLVLVAMSNRTPSSNFDEMRVTVTSGTSPTPKTNRFTTSGVTDGQHSLIVEHSPASTSAVTYQVQYRVSGATGFVNPNGTHSSITVMEVAG